MHSLWCDMLYKLSLANHFRLAYAESIMDKIVDSADRPLDGGGWWTQSEEPWQTLACCMEIANALRSPNPEEYMCGFPVHQDGSCNGLQHYAALGGDAAGAAAVNLAPLDRPQDVYSAVAAKVEEMRKRDAAAGVPAAVLLEDFVRRKVIKQTVMTTVRPCTMKQRNAFPPNFIHSLDSSHMMLTSLHCETAGLTFVSVHDCFWTHPHTVDAMNEVRPCRILMRAPIGTVQRYTFVSVHDCFWTHPHTVDAMNEVRPCRILMRAPIGTVQHYTFVSVCREQFVALHSQPILDDLSQFLVKRYSYDQTELESGAGSFEKRRVNSLLGKVPPKGTFDLNSVLKSVYFFS
ncbi:DNA-directed RNA polymerase [Operophtera brumata]|uniref:DNA-directed RNA polymerase n=1 Tax=Operophtera brumata TaxID=104452 RepID=A0A0L7KZB2_OPEBR|nr:DNA-directed RNA polymerase [Operophtera brumata]